MGDASTRNPPEKGPTTFLQNSMGNMLPYFIHLIQGSIIPFGSLTPQTLNFVFSILSFCSPIFVKTEDT